MRSATHLGSCQLCGHEQKLPRFLLSIHGYSVKWNCFVGTCPGSRHQPYELSANLLPSRVKMARHEAALLKANAAAARAETTAEPPMVWVLERTHEHGKTTSRWMKLFVCGVTVTGNAYYGAIDWTTDGKKFTARTSGNGKLTPVAYQNEQYAATLDRDAKHYDEYAEWCEKRVASWKLVPLKPVPPPVAKAPKCPHDTGYQTYTGRHRLCGEPVAYPGALCSRHGGPVAVVGPISI
jgi:hypothetical protein